MSNERKQINAYCNGDKTSLNFRNFNKKSGMGEGEIQVCCGIVAAVYCLQIFTNYLDSWQENVNLQKKYRLITLKIATFSPRQLQGRAFPGQLSLGADLKSYVGLTKSASSTDLCGMLN